MALFIVRIELHGASYGDYENLHKAMQNVGFSRQISNGGRNYQLPTAEYCVNESRNVSFVLSVAQKAANSTGKTSWILVTQSAATDWALPLA